MTRPIDVTIVGGGMITADLILPAVYHLQRTGVVGELNICALNSPPLKELKDNAAIREAFPGQDFNAFPSVDEKPDAVFPDLYKEVMDGMKPRQLVIVALPDQLHHGAVKEALERDQHVLCVKPLVLRYEQAAELEKLALERGLFVGVEYHKRFDRRCLVARREYRMGWYGDFKCGDARLIEPYYYRSSNFQNWFTVDKTDPFVYVGCHYVDLVYFITGLRPTAVSVDGVKGEFPNGNEGWMWTHGRVRWENDALLNVLNGLGYPDEGAGSNDQGLMMVCEGEGHSGLISHNDQMRGVAYSYLKGAGNPYKRYCYINPDFFRFVPWEGDGFKPIGYGPDSVSASVTAAHRIENAVADLDGAASLDKRREMIKEIDERGLIATPANSSINELVVEAARQSIMSGGETVRIVYGDKPRVEK